eukprot:TRINITY_DN4779_c0_g1_i1.p1 TRINITY_DN4779_c0_g1~~TRINITY_DN4779_c0_g1_i1.p1  ORF type:complete len:283 (-),score=61.46 TRINITY_DN4779_c0_g1_i1:197-1045(-)
MMLNNILSVHRASSLSSSVEAKRTYAQFVYRAGPKFKRTLKKRAHRALKAERQAKKKKFTLEDLRKQEEGKKVTPPTSLTVPVLSFRDGKPTGQTVTLDSDIFAVPVRSDILHRYVVWHNANIRQGSSKTKSRGEVQGSTRKLYKQKGSGRARRGSIRSPVLRGGGRAFAKVPKDWSFPLPKKVRRLALRSALSAKFAQNQIFIVDNMDYVPQIRTSSASKNPDEISGKDFCYTSPLAKLFKSYDIKRKLIIDSTGPMSYSLMKLMPERNYCWQLEMQNGSI